MDDYQHYCDLIDYLNTRDARERNAKKHRLPLDAYARSDCEYFFTICARQHGQPFLRPELARAVIDALLWRRQAHHWTLPCYCLMPDHLHFIVHLPDSPPREINAGARGIVPAGILEQVASFKSYTTSRIWWTMGGSGPLWQRSSYDHVVRYNQSLGVVAQYVLNNPVRKNLAGRWQDYPYSAIVDPW